MLIEVGMLLIGANVGMSILALIAANKIERSNKMKREEKEKLKQSIIAELQIRSATYTAGGESIDLISLKSAFEAVHTAFEEVKEDDI